MLVGVLLGCERSAPGDGQTAEAATAVPADSADSTPAVIDAEWVASKLQAPPPPERKDWSREIEKDPMAALKQMDPSSLQARRGSSPGTRDPSAEGTPAPGKRSAKYDPGTPLRVWPPSVGAWYRDLVLKDQTGAVTALSDFRGKVILLEVVGLTCRACHAFAGGNEAGKEHFRGIEPQRGLGSIEEYARGYAKVSLDHPDIVFVQLVLYGMDGRSAPDEADVRAWASHFQMDRNRNEVVLIGDGRFISPETRALIPGFHLIDRNGILRAMSSNNPRHDRLHESLLPKLATLVQERR